MTERLAQLAPEMARTYGLKPWELRRLTLRELEAFLAHHEELTADEDQQPAADRRRLTLATDDEVM